ncbi:winged helix-turn-helix transcriptional regulator [Natronorarus salvus]|uniref:winged helix-turn-helix transcriptional regulator n=1 Tax=Natronorarus salvus TaxID=3117733 RepID=UPI002F26A12E
MSGDPRIELTGLVHRNPGIHFNALVRELGVSPERVDRYVRDHLEYDTIVRESVYGQTHYYPPKFDAWERTALAMLRRETSRDIIVYLLEHGESSPSEILETVGIARSTLSWHLDRLTEQDIVEKRRDGNRIWLDISRPDDLEPLLGEVRPLLPERLLDRAERLIDTLFEDVG